MKRFILTLVVTLAWALSACAQKGLNVAQYFSDTYRNDNTITMVEVTGDSRKMPGIDCYRSITVVGNDALSEKLEKSVKKDGAAAKSKEVIYKKGKLYFGMYFMGGSDNHRRYLYFLNQKAMGKDKTMLIFIEGDISEEMAKSLIKM